MKRIPLLPLLAFLALPGCGQGPPSEPRVNVDGSKYLLSSEPEGGKGVLAIRQKAQDGEEVVVVGRIGGQVNPWVKGLAAFTIVDPSLQPCSAEENCPTPWDYCCETNLSSATVLVQIVDTDGDRIRADARDLFGLEELQTVVVRGQAIRGKDKALKILATGLYVRKD